MARSIAAQIGHSGRITGNPEVSWNRVEMSVLPTNWSELRNVRRSAQNLLIVLAMHFRNWVFFICAFSLCAVPLLWPLPVWASDGKPNERMYNAPFEKVWTVCVQTANEKWKVTHTDQANGILKFRQGTSFKTNSWGMNVRVTVGKVDESHTKVTLTSEKIDPLELSWAGRDIAKRFFAALDNSVVSSTAKTDNSITIGSGDQHRQTAATSPTAN
jgi:hypothetical protein